MTVPPFALAPPNNLVKMLEGSPPPRLPSAALMPSLSSVLARLRSVLLATSASDLVPSTAAVRLSTTPVLIASPMVR